MDSKAGVAARLEALGVKLTRARARLADGRWREDKWGVARVGFWRDGTVTVNLVDVPRELAQEAIDCGLAR